MRTARSVGIASLFVLLLAACGGRDVSVQIQVEDRSGSAAGDSQPATALPPLAAAETSQPTAAPVQQEALSTAVDIPAAVSAEPFPTEAAPSPLPIPGQGEAPAADLYSFDPAIWDQGLATLSSFRQKVVLDFTADDSGVHSKVTYEGEVTVEPNALHSVVRVEGQGSEQLPTNQVDVIWIGEQGWVKIGRRPWVPVPVSALESEYAGEVVAVGDLLPFVQQAARVLPDETVNGIPCEHYVYNLDNLEGDAGMSSAQGDIWVAQDGDFVVRLTLNGQGTYAGTYSASGTLHLVYDLYDVNVPLAISPPR